MNIHGFEQKNIFIVNWKTIWDSHFRKPLDSFSPLILTRGMRSIFDKLKWNEVYDFIEALGDVWGGNHFAMQFRASINLVLEQERAGYRLIDDCISPIISSQEIASIEQAIEHKDGFSEHIRTALHLLSDREQPDYRNSIKESISAVESIFLKISGERSFAKAKIWLQQTMKLHGGLISGFDKFYGYTSDDAGIRHALMDEVSLNYEDAHYFLIMCSAFINYLMCKASKSPTDPSAGKTRPT